MLLAVVTGQRPGDISEMKFRDIWDDHLHIIQQKTGTQLAIPLSLRCQALNISLRDVIAGCRVTANTLTTNFKKARDKADIDRGESTPATFHKMRLLSERLYREQGTGN